MIDLVCWGGFSQDPRSWGATRPYSVTFQTRNYQPATPPRGRFTPITCSWRALGGPERASIAVTGDPRILGAYAGLLGVPVMIHDPLGCPYWWGYLHGIDFYTKGFIHHLDLDDLANRLAVLHTLPDGVTTNLTGWADDAGSQSIYGVRERILTLEAVSEERALAWRDAELKSRAHPGWAAEEAVNEEATFTLECRSWYETLGWRYYACAEGDAVETTVQMANILSASGQFLSGIGVESPSGVFTLPGREGVTTARMELELLAGLGDDAGRPYRMRIDNHRVLVVEKVPLAGESDWSLGEDGCYRDQYGVRQPAWANPAGRWVRPVGWTHTTAQVLGGGEGVGFVEEWEYNFIYQI